ncbi:MAG: hypothetical protein D6798_10280 [Deltaproteobacteria bacterium]|nr:MAG: hypothetical protein D6798_10280 [Deltaproteobacteria bacterium]
MGLFRLVFILAVILAAAWLLRDVLARIGRWLDPSDGTDDGPARAPRRPQLVAIERSPQEVLGLDDDASPFEIERAYRRIMADNAPEKVAGLSPELQEYARRLREDATAAYQSLRGEPEAAVDEVDEEEEG